LYEIDLTLDALNHMKLALKKSLTEQWQAEKLRQEQISALAHDLKTPLTIIRGNTELLYDTDLTIEQQECADYITDSYMQMQVYVKTLIDLSTASTGYQLNKEILNLPDYLKQVKVSIDALCRTKEIHLQMSMSDIPTQLTADKVLLGRAIQNVVNNALDYSPQNGTLHIDVYGKDNFVDISVTDEGGGFSDEALQHAQEQFFMDDQSRNSKLHFGMGLYIAKSIMEQHNGELILENSKSTGGAKVILKIPF
ncbi:MAG: HAMP domain-containing histidine kinase, partial [Lachnospiraceae bacterium]|nr:HAMP domain-containing histidine kinase [Lachnospiraceae bacterium]